VIYVGQSTLKFAKLYTNALLPFSKAQNVLFTAEITKINI